jgi:GNAT superfamily N-acetyltransferase
MALGYVRPARADEAAEIARIQLTTWRHAYRRLIPRHVLDELDEDWVVQRWRTSIEEPPSPRHRVLVAVEQAETEQAEQVKSAYLVGFAASGDADDAALAPGESPAALGPEVAAITDLLVEPRWSRRGHGSRLLAASADLWRPDGYARAVVWTFEADAVSRTFFGSSGWEPDGVTRALDVDDLLVPQLRLHTSLV